MSVTHDKLSETPPDDSGASVKWFVRKPDGSVYGPETAEVLREWAAECRLVCGNEVSKDKKHWIAAEDLPHLEMNWVAESPDGRRYGPFNILATRELFEHEVLPEDAVLTELKTGEKSTVAEQLKAFAADTPVDRIAEVDEMVGPAVFLASQASSFCTGVNLLVDGGFVCW